MLEGCVLLPGLPLWVVDPGVVCGDPAGGVAVPAGGVALVDGGVAVPAGGVGAVPPEGAVCAATQHAQHKTTGSTINFFIDIFVPSILSGSQL